MVVNNYAQYCSVVKTGFGKAKIVIGGEVDARELCGRIWTHYGITNGSPVWDCKPDRNEDIINWVELKTSAELQTERDSIKFERKLLKFWAQSFLLGVPKIIVGFRTKNGILQRVKEFETKNIPTDIQKEGRGTWNGNVCINFAASFLDCMPTYLY